MTGRRRLVAVAAAAGVLTGSVLMGGAVHAQDALDAAVAEVGWWSRRPGASAQPQGGFEVAEGLGEALSVAALRVRITGDLVIDAELVLTEDGGIGSAAAALQVCATGPAWSEANPGSWEDAPPADCASSADLERGGDGRWVADISGLVVGPGGETSLMVVPAEIEEGLPAGPGFQVLFSAASVSAHGHETSTGPGVASAGSDGGALDGGGGFVAGPGAFSEPFPSSPQAGGGFDFEPAPVPSDGDPDLVDEGDAGEEEADGQVPFDRVAAAPVGRQQDRPWHRLVVLVPLSAALGAATAYTRQRGWTRPPVL